MAKALVVRQSYRLYAAALLVWGGWSLVWGVTSVQMAPTTVGYGWFALAAAGVPVAGGLYATRSDVFTGRARVVERFERHSLSGVPLGVYAALLVVWSLVFLAWATGVVGVSATVVGYGWLAIAAYGTVLTVGLVVIHREKVLDAARISTFDANQL